MSWEEFWSGLFVEGGLDSESEVVERVASESAAGFGDRVDHGQVAAVGCGFGAEAQFAKDDRLPQCLFGRVIGRSHTVVMSEHEQTEAVIAQTAAGFGGRATGAVRAVHSQALCPSSHQPVSSI